MSSLTKIIVVVVALAVVGAGGYWVFYRETVRTEVVPATALTTPDASTDDRYKRLREAQGSIDKLQPLELPSTKTQAQRASDVQR
jgi:hypothetical protein